jgi:flagellar hook-length control protein FliK
MTTDQNAPNATPAQDQPTGPTAQAPTQAGPNTPTAPRDGEPPVPATSTPDPTPSGSAQRTKNAAYPADAAPGVPDRALAGVAGPAPTAPTTAAAVQSAAPPPSAAPPAPPAAQIAMRIVPLRLEADGVHRLTVNLHPADLGPVQVVAEIRNGDVSLQLSGSTDAGTAALRDSLDDLRRELTDAGFGNCDLDLRQGSADARQEQPRQHFGPGRAQATTPAPTVAPAGVAEKTGRLDVRA